MPQGLVAADLLTAGGEFVNGFASLLDGTPPVALLRRFYRGDLISDRGGKLCRAGCADRRESLPGGDDVLLDLTLVLVLDPEVARFASASRLKCSGIASTSFGGGQGNEMRSFMSAVSLSPTRFRHMVLG